ncbi:hypothetical protein LCGC14_2517050, partial [marine sediment metagenome]
EYTIPLYSRHYDSVNGVQFRFSATNDDAPFKLELDGLFIDKTSITDKETTGIENYSIIIDYKTDILRYISEESNGVPRAALSYLQQVAAEGSWTKDNASLIINAGVDIDHVEVFDFCRLIIKERNFQKSVKAYSKIKKIPIEIIRMAVCGFFVGCLKRANNLKDAQQFSEIIDLTSKPYFNNPKPEHILMNSLFKITQILRRTS